MHSILDNVLVLFFISGIKYLTQLKGGGIYLAHSIRVHPWLAGLMAEGSGGGMLLYP